MRFLGRVWRLLVGIKDGLVLLFMLLFFGLLYAAITSDPRAGAVSEGALALNFEGGLSEQPAEPDPFSLLSNQPVLTEKRVRDVVYGLQRAAADSRVKAVSLDLDRFTGAGQVALSDVGAGLDAVRRAGKPVLAYATAYTDDSYLLAAHASEVWLNPLGAAMIAGPGGNNLYYKGLLDKMGVTANVYRVGTYKAAVEPFIRNDMSPESREANQAIVDALWSSWQDEVRRVRPKAQVAAYVSNLPARMQAAGGDGAQAALQAGLVDRIGDRTAFGRRMAEIVGTKHANEPGSYKAIDYEAWTGANPAASYSGQIGVVTIAGEIIDGKAGPGTAAGDTIAEYIHKGLKDHDLKALVVRVDSPGGSVTASERIRQAILSAKAKGIPVVVSMGSLAASGGYWVATPADRIFAEPGTITGSIGVFGILPSFQGTLAKLGVGTDGVKSTPLSGEPDLLRGPSPEAGQLVQSSVENIYRRFLTIVGQSRKMDPAAVDRIAQGRVWDGGTARQIGLVDQFGSLDDAVADAARRAKLDPATARRVYLEEDPDFFTRMLTRARASDSGGGQDALGYFASRGERQLLRGLADAQSILTGPTIQVRCLDCPPSTRPLAKAEKQGLMAWFGGLFTR